MAQVIVSRVRATLHKQGFQGFSKEQILDMAAQLGVDAEKPTPEETKAVVEALKALSIPSTDMVPVEDGTEQGQGSVIAPTTEPTEAINQEQLDMLPSVEPASLTTYQETSEMVQAQAQEMGVVLSDGDVQAISDNIAGQSMDADEINQEIRSAISAYIQYHKAQNLGRVSKLVKEVYKEQSEANREVSQALASGLQQFSRDMEVSRQHTKSTFRNALKCFAIPGTEA